jgi:DNA-binding transcriptional LysR family regulator
MPIELKLLRCAVALSEHTNFARAAHALYVSQPTLSRNIQDIERRVGTQLFERGTGGVVPTEAGKIFLEQAREMIARSGDLDREMNLLRGLEKGELNVGAGTYPSAMMVDRAVVRLVRAHPSIRLQIHSDNREKLLPLLRKRELDLAVVGLRGDADDSDLYLTKLNRHQGYFVVRSRHPLLGSKAVPTLRSILQFPLAMTSRVPTLLMKQLLAGAPGIGADHSIAKSFPPIACDSVAMMKMLVTETDTVSVLPLNAVTAEVRTGQLKILSFVPPWLQSDFGILRLAHRSLSPVGETFVRLLKEVDAELLNFEQKNAPRIIAAPNHARRKAR